MIDLITVMALITVTWALTGAAMVGVGAAVMRAVGDTPTNATHWLLAFWAGLALWTGALQVWHFIAPVNAAATWALYGLGVAGLLWAARAFPKTLWRAVREHHALTALFLLILGFAANNAILQPVRYDTGLYQIQSFMWTNTYPIVPGLGNLHGRLAFNNSFHIVIAALNHALPLGGRGMHLA
ncbi:MAG: hypothetical protein AAF125_04085, partial [Chloroflexota bacterium]